MPNRVTSDQLKQYLDLEPNDTTDLSLYLTMGNMLVEDSLIGHGLTDNRLFLIELNLDAHYASLSVEKGGMIVQAVGSSREEYQSERSLKPNFSRTRFGQQAVTLDPTGILADMDTSVGSAEFRVL